MNGNVQQEFLAVLRDFGSHRFDPRIDAGLRFKYRTDMPKKKNTKKVEKNAFLGNLDRLGGKKLMQHGAEESSKSKESRKHSVGGGRKSG
jgi:hypothetical protein